MKRLLLGIALLCVLGACSSGDSGEPLPVLLSEEEAAATIGVLTAAEIAETQTARAPTATLTATPLTPSPTIPTLTPSHTPTATLTLTATPNQIEATITRIAELTIIAQTATAPTHTPTLTSTATYTATYTVTPSNTPFPTPQLPDVPSPNAIVFISARAETRDIWLMRVDGEPSRPLYTSNDAEEQAFTCDPFAELLVFERVVDGRRQLFSITYTGVNFNQLTTSEGENYDPVWSPDGQQLAFVSTRTEDAGIWLLGRDGLQLRQLTLHPADEVDPSWSADGSVIFYSSNRDGNYDIFQYNLDTNVETQITFTPDLDERQPALSPDFQNIVYVAKDTQQERANTLYMLDSNGFVQELLTVADGEIETPTWLDANRVLFALTTADGGRQVARIRLDQPNDYQVLTEIGRDNYWPQYCYVPAGFIEQLPERRATPIFRPTLPTNTPAPLVTSTLTPIMPSPSAPSVMVPQFFTPVESPPEDWLISRETWTPEEFALIVPPIIPTSRRGFLIDNLINFTWQDDAGIHVASIALEAFRGELATVLIGYTLNDLPGPITDLVGIEEAFNTAVLQNSVRTESYTLTDITYTDVNVTLSFRVPALAPRPEPSAYVVYTRALPNNWLISTERWSGTELAILANRSEIADLVGVTFDGQEVIYQWEATDGLHILRVRFEARGGNLVVSPASYTINGNIADPPTDVLYAIREGLLTNSIPPGEFYLSRIEYDLGAFELVFVVPPVQ